MKTANFIFLFLALDVVLPSWSDTYVRGYYRSNGTYVAPHYRRSHAFSVSFAPVSGGQSRHPYFIPGRKGNAAADPNSVKDNRTREHRATDEGFRKIEAAIRKFQETAHGKVPASLDLLVEQGEGGATPVDGWGTKFHYVAGVRDFALVSAGPDRKLNTADDIRSPMGMFIEPAAGGGNAGTKESFDTDEGFRKVEAAIRKFQETSYGKVPASLESLREAGYDDFPLVDGWGMKFRYAADVRDFALVSGGPDRRLGTADDLRSPKSTLLKPDLK